MFSPRTLRLAALVDLAAPAALGVVVFFGGAVVSNCLGGPNSMCPVPVVPPIRSSLALGLYLAVCIVAWLVASCVVLANLWKTDRRRLMRLAAGIAVVTIAMAGTGFVQGLGVRLRAAAEGASAWGLAGFVLAWIVAVAWVGLRPGDDAPMRQQAA